MSGQVAITGVGYTRFSRDREHPRTVGTLAAEACLAAVADAGYEPRDIDAILSYHANDSVAGRDVAAAIGVPELRWWGDIFAGGSYTAAIVGTAAALISSGQASRVLCYRAMNGFTGRRIGKGGGRDDAVDQFMLPVGVTSPAQIFGMTCRRHMHRYGTTREQLGQVAITLRGNAVHNPRALRRTPLTMPEYLAGRPIADPYTLYDCCQESDGACAIVVSAAEEVPDRPRPGVYPLAVQMCGAMAPRLPFDGSPDLATSAFGGMAKRLYERSGRTPADVDVALLYDAFTFEVIQQLEDFGFCGEGEGGAYVESGAIALDGAIPVNPHGGLLSEAYVHGLNHVVEAVHQLRGESQTTQVPGADVALVTGFAFTSGSAMLLASEAARD